MGSIRYLLTGPLAAKLSRHLPAKTRFRDFADPSYAGPPASMANDLLGGGEVKGSGQLFSPVIVALRGRARLKTVAFAPLRLKGEPRLPRGGTLYTMRVTRMLAVLDKQSYSRLTRSASFHRAVRAATRAGRRGAFAALDAAVSACLLTLRQGLPPLLAPHLLPLRRMRRLRDEARRIAASKSTTASPLLEAIHCDRVGMAVVYAKDQVGKALGQALRACAIGHCLQVAESSHPRRLSFRRTFLAAACT